MVSSLFRGMVKTKSVIVKILFFIDCLVAGGKERRLTQLMKGLKLRQDIEFELVVMNSEIHYKEILDWDIKIHYILRKSKKDISVFRKFYKICKIYQPDIVHCWESMAAVIAVPVCKILNIKLVNGMVTNTPVKQNALNKYWLRAKLTFPFSNIIIGNSQAGLKAYGAPANKSECIYNGIDLSRFENLKNKPAVMKEIFGNIPKDIFVVGMVAAFEDRKDYKLLIKAAESLLSVNSNIRFVLVGDGANFYEIKNQVPSILSDKIIFLGKKSDVESIVNIFDVGVLLTNTKVHGEGISNSLLEYMALSKPVIATRSGGTTELIVDRHNGYLIDGDNDKQLIDAIGELMKNRNLIHELGNNGKQLVHQKFDSSIITNHYANMYYKLLA